MTKREELAMLNSNWNDSTWATMQEILEGCDRTVAYEEILCGGRDAAGGGCGAPRGINTFDAYKADDEVFNFRGRTIESRDSWYEHNEWEGPSVEGSRRVILVFAPCRECIR